MKDLSVLLVEDFLPLAQEVKEVLEEFFDVVIVAENGEEALVEYERYYKNTQKNFDFVISDIQMPNMDGMALSKALLKTNPSQIIIILSAYTDSEQLVHFINLGISKFIKKPIQYDVFLNYLLEESRNIPQMTLSQTQEALELGEGYVWNQDTSVLSNGEKEIVLTRGDIVLLQLLIIKKGTICTVADIVDYFQLHDMHLDERNIRNAVFKLRKKLPKKTIQSVYGIGYKFIF